MHLSAFLQFEYFTDCSIKEYQSVLDKLSSVFWNICLLCQHNTLAYYAFYYAGIFDAGLVHTTKDIRAEPILLFFSHLFFFPANFFLIIYFSSNFFFWCIFSF